jgi:hypothetical protein
MFERRIGKDIEANLFYHPIPSFFFGGEKKCHERPNSNSEIWVDETLDSYEHSVQ